MAIYFYSFNSSSYPTGNVGLLSSIDSYTESSSGVVVITTPTTFSLNSGVVVGDAIKLFDDSDNSNFIYAVITAFSAVVGGAGYLITVSYDYNIYNDDLANMDKFNIYAEYETNVIQPYNKYITSTQNSSYSYKINARVETAVYSEQYIRYKINTYYDVVLDSTRRYFFEDFINIATAGEIIMIDDCASPNGVAYKVYMPETNFQLFNNKFRKNVTFKIVA